MTIIANCLSMGEALHLQMALEAAGIPPFIPDETTATLAPHHFLAGGGVRLQVADEHATGARKLVAEARR